MPDDAIASRGNSPAAFTDLHTRARRVGQWVWLERRVFEVLGAWAGTSDEPGVAVLFGEMSRRHGWHSEVFFDRLPELASVDAEGLVASPGPATSAFIDALGEPTAAGSLERLVGAYRVLLPMLLTEYRLAAESVSSVAEPSLRRWLDIVVRDDLQEWSRGQELLLDALVDPAAVRAGAERQVELELAAVATRRLTR